MRDGFSTPDMTAALDVQACVQACPAQATTRGMFLGDIVDALKSRGLPVPDRRYHAFGTYPQREFIEVAAAAAGRIYANLPPREGLRRLGQLAYPTFRDTMIGKVMFGVLGKDLQAVMKLVPRGYDAILSHGRAEIVEVGSNFAHVRLVDVHTFLSSYQVGVFEGALVACERQGSVGVHLESPSTGEFFVEWT